MSIYSQGAFFRSQWRKKPLHKVGIPHNPNAKIFDDKKLTDDEILSTIKHYLSVGTPLWINDDETAFALKNLGAGWSQITYSKEQL